MFNNVILNDPDGLACTIRRHLACLKTIKGDCICYNGIMRPHTIENIMYRITHIQSLVHIEVLLFILWEDDSQYESSF